MTTVVKERPILFSAPMVRAILAGEKTQTRRVVNPQPPEGIDDVLVGQLRTRAPYQLEHPETGVVCGVGFQDDDDRFYRCPYGAPGDRLWVRERHWFREKDGVTCYADASLTTHPTSLLGARHYEPSQPPTDDWPNNAAQYGFVCRPSIHMPRWASRITLEVTGIGVEHLQDIWDSEIRSEGLDCPEHDFPGGMCIGPRCGALRAAFAETWDSLNAARGFSWAFNPWVWVVEFRRLEP